MTFTHIKPLTSSYKEDKRVLSLKERNDEFTSPLKGKSAFIASPMSGFSDDHLYKKNRDEVLALMTHLVDRHGFKSTYFAGQDLASKADFNSNNHALESDMSALIDSDVFILVYPNKVISSVLIEAGYALALKKPMLLLVKERKDLPYLLQEAEKLSGSSIFPKIEIQSYKDEKSLKHRADVSIPKLLD